MLLAAAGAMREPQGGESGEALERRRDFNPRRTNMKRLFKAAARAAVPVLLLSVAAIAPAAPSAKTDADPAIWVVQDEDTTVYLFGTFHVGDGKAEWFNDEIKTAFDKSGEVYLEALQPEDPASLAPIIQKYAIDTSGKPLSEKLSPKGREKLVQLLAGMGAPPTAFDKFKPMFATMTLAMIPYQALGMTGENGSEKALTAAAKASGKTLGELEGFEAQLKMLEGIPEPTQLRSLEELLADYEEAPEMIKRMVTYWNSGNADGFADIMKEMQGSAPDFYKVMMTDRNATWADWIDKRLDKPGTVFLGVGTAHLAGKDSVQQFLAKRGINSKRFN
jgi:hypothetical protein